MKNKNEIPKKINFYDINLSELEIFVQSIDEPRFRAKQIWKGIYRNYWENSSQFSNIPISLRQIFEEMYELKNLIPKIQLNSNDKKTSKILFQLNDATSIETVLMDYDKRHTLCVSTQAGCGIGCVFCATGQMGFQRNLSSGEIIEQVLFFERSLSSQGQKLTNLVFMGMGEPFLNYQNTMAAIDQLNNPDSLNIGERRFTISTVGIVPAIHQFTKNHRQINLAVSLHAADDDLRSSIIPINKKYPISDLMDVCKEYISLTHRRITFEYALIEGINDSLQNAKGLANLLKGLLCHVNLIPLNPTTQYAGKGSSNSTAVAFSSILNQVGIQSTIRLRRGIDIHAGCGQLASSTHKKNLP